MSEYIGGLSLFIAGIVWLGLLFAVALHGDRSHPRWQRLWPVVYSLSLAVYCTAWTFYGTTTQAVRSGWPIPPTFVGTILLFVLGWPFLVRLITLSKANNSTSIADFIASRFGKSTALAAAVTAVAALGIIPYIALQLKAVAMSFSIMGAGSAAWQDVALYVALLMGVFVVLFGTRRAAATAHNPGLVLAMGFESLLKLTAMLALGVFVLFVLFPGPAAFSAETTSIPFRDGDTFLTLVLLGALAMFTLPHQFHIGVVECRDASHMRTARWLFPLFLLLISLPILLLARAGNELLGDLGVAPDLYVLLLPLSSDAPGLALFATLGGLSAATGMVILASLTLAIMMGNHWLTPLLLRRSGGLRVPVLSQRRVGIGLVMGLAYLYSREIGYNEALGDIGALSFSGLAQLAPAVLLAVYRPGLPARAILGGLLAGSAVWAYVLLLPVIEGAAGTSTSWGAPENLLGLGWLSPLPRAVLVSLAVNLLVIFAISRLTQGERQPRGATARLQPSELEDVARHFLTPSRVREIFSGRRHGSALEAAVEHELAAVVGAASARLLLDAARKRAPAPLDTVVDLVGQATAQARFSYEVLSGALQHMSHGVCVVDAEQRLVAWNRRYLELFDYPPELIRVGCPVADLLLHNARRGRMGEENHATAVERRLAHMRAGTEQRTERVWPDGRVIEIRGDPMPGGGFVATFADVTELRRTDELEQAKVAAERANEAKSRFLAAVSHDLVQPLNAAHLMTWSLAQRLRDGEEAEALDQIGGAIGATEALLSGLLDISRLESGQLEPRVTRLALNELFAQLAGEFAVLAAERGLEFRWVPTRVWVQTDPQLLRRILQNFLSNAVRYTERGKVLFGCRQRGDSIVISVWDTGPGIPVDARTLIFEEFRRLTPDERAPGLGLGLAIAERMASLLQHPLELDSWPGHGTCFSVTVPRTQPGTHSSGPERSALGGMLGARVLTVDNDPSMLESLKRLLTDWGCEVVTARNALEAEAACAGTAPDIVLLDYHLDAGETGLEVLAHLRQKLRVDACVVISADHGSELRRDAEAAGCELLHKPIKPLALRSLLRRLLAARARGA